MKYHQNHNWLRQMFIPSQWNLGRRLFFTTGILLIIGATLAFTVVSYNLNETAKSAVHSRLNDYYQLILHHQKALQNKVNSSVAILSVNDEVTSAMEDQNQLGLQLSIATIKDKILVATGEQLEALQFYSDELEPLFHSQGLNRSGDLQRGSFPMAEKAVKTNSTVTGIQLVQSLPLLSAVTPAKRNGQLVGYIEATASYQELFEQLNLSDEFGMALILDETETATNSATPEKNRAKTTKEQSVLKFGTTNLEAYKENPPLQPGLIASRKNSFFKETAIINFEGLQVGRLILFYNGVKELDKLYSILKIMSWMTLIGIVIVFSSLFFYVNRILQFLKQLSRAITYSITNDYKQPFIADHTHCCTVFDCDPGVCPVSKDSTKICYLTVGHRAILPELRNTCPYIDTYRSCRECPVYETRPGDELTEIQHGFNALTAIWQQFLSQAGSLFSGVFRNSSDKVPNLDSVAEYLQQMAGLSTFGHDMQGVYSKEEVYQQLQWIFEQRFKLSNFNLLEVNSSENRMKSVISLCDLSRSHMDVLVDCELCRAKRVAEEITSENNPHLCPYFDIEHEKEVRCCLPMVMGGRVGAVFTFVCARPEWEEKKNDLPIIMKYLEETAPTLASLRLIQISREQALRDPLTKCHNRRFMDEYLVQLEGLNSRSPRNVGFIMADLDHFKMVNDEFGHLAGDEILKQLAEILRNNIRKTDLLIRYGGEEFLIVLMEMSNKGEAFQIAEKLRTAVEAAKLSLPTGGAINKTISMGVAEFPKDGEYLYKAIKYADVALYQAKEQGRNKVLCFEPEMWKEEDY